MDASQRPPVVMNLSSPTRIGRTYSVALAGMKGQIVSIEADIGNTLPGFTLLGLPDQSLQEAKDRIRAAARNSGLPLTRRHLTVNLTPASLHKRGSVFDLAIIMAAWGADYSVQHETGPVFLAALGLDGSLQTAPGILPAVMAAVEAGHKDIVVAEEARAQAQIVPEARVRGYRHLSQIAADFGAPVEPRDVSAPAVVTQPTVPLAVQQVHDLADVQGQQEARWALEIAAAGGHHLLLEGPPGAGKTMLAQRLPSIMAAMDPKTALENAAIRSLLDGAEPMATLSSQPPFQAPHHSATATALLGGGSGFVRPGAVSQAHGGVLFLDEAAEFKRSVLDTLRQPLETGSVTLHRARHTVEFPARFQLVLATNPCPCGHGHGTGRHCRCSSLQRRRYAAKLSGPLLDRVDLQVSVEPVTSRHFTNQQPTETSTQVAQRVNAAIERAKTRLSLHGLYRNHQVPIQLLHDPSLMVSKAGKRILDRALDSHQISARGYGRVMRVAWTIADLMQADRPDSDHVDMALYLRLNEKGYRHG
ncbi:YifB family Mg chelatase-like AAA ATPase [Enteractinococcus fodinae]|uniref:Magnesium chelatase family protein n=1 Tax=Enteractinococcus fodinae TaxID=684663 RepID=A0ABU2AZZ5_9MICC|nr:YifB family Mg chelatase-like AAA ATPase [Enteractinococcus fodinae]MDR7346928.1 magnesium chelatase family protein [Enteractinococcus fodinae]